MAAARWAGVIAYDTADAKDLLQAGQTSGYRVFGTAATGDHSLGMGCQRLWPH
ncbi:Uncharacterised protein [Leclercia adecarboxylata]|uniref:Uncharacterized protein n=1 Tax=Leclercia adecarboxylata TaxID=83655 RepID=A0A4U9HRR5_9ENTR|nr:Uncharacterised protein [Leclercia adecarboxylata]